MFSIKILPYDMFHNSTLKGQKVADVDKRFNLTKKTDNPIDPRTNFDLSSFEYKLIYEDSTIRVERLPSTQIYFSSFGMRRGYNEHSAYISDSNRNVKQHTSNRYLKNDYLQFRGVGMSRPVCQPTVKNGAHLSGRQRGLPRESQCDNENEIMSSTEEQVEVEKEFFLMFDFWQKERNSWLQSSDNKYFGRSVRHTKIIEVVEKMETFNTTPENSGMFF